MPLAGLGGARGDFAREIRIPADPLLQQRDELCRPDYRFRRHAMMRVERAAVIHRPLANLDIGEADVDPCRCLRHHVDPAFPRWYRILRYNSPEYSIRYNILCEIERGSDGGPGG